MLIWASKTSSLSFISSIQNLQSPFWFRWYHRAQTTIILFLFTMAILVYFLNYWCTLDWLWKNKAKLVLMQWGHQRVYTLPNISWCWPSVLLFQTRQYYKSLEEYLRTTLLPELRSGQSTKCVVAFGDSEGIPTLITSVSYTFAQSCNVETHVSEI